MREPIFVVTTPYSGVQSVVCYHDTWHIHLAPAGRLFPGAREATIQTLEEPSAVCLGTTNPEYLAFVNQNIASSGNRKPFVVIVDPKGNPLPAVASIGFRRDFANLSPHTILWKR
jgi:hypothetical protein